MAHFFKKITNLLVRNGALFLVVIVALLHAVVLELGDVAVVACVDIFVHAFQLLLPLDRAHGRLLRDALHAGRRIEDRLREVDLSAGQLVAANRQEHVERHQRYEQVVHIPSLSSGNL